jgi:hypothetical protein
VPARSSYDYAILRVVPRVDREEFLNAGVVLFCLERDFLGARVGLDEARVKAAFPDADLGLLREHLAVIPRICEGGPEAGPIGKLTKRERFHWLVAPRSTIVQVSPVHVGLCEDPAAALADVFAKMVG